MEGERTQFRCSWSLTIWAATAFVCALVPGLAVIAVVAGPNDPGAFWVLIGAVPVVALAFGACWLYAPRGYAVGPLELRVLRPGRDLVIPLGNVADLRAVSRRALGFAIRLWGVGGLFGHYGIYWTSTLGICHLHITRRDRLVLVVLKGGRRIVLSPDERDRFVEVLRKAMEGLER